MGAKEQAGARESHRLDDVTQKLRVNCNSRVSACRADDPKKESKIPDFLNTEKVRRKPGLTITEDC